MLLPYQERVVIEKQELDDKIDKLEAFLRSENYQGVDLLNQQLMMQQLGIMLAYSSILSRRIETFQQTTKETNE